MTNDTALAASLSILEAMKLEIEKAYDEVDGAIKFVEEGELNTAAGGMYITEQSLQRVSNLFTAFKEMHMIARG